MKTEYPYYVAVKVSAGQLLKVYKDKKFKSYNDCYDLIVVEYNLCIQMLSVQE